MEVIMRNLRMTALAAAAAALLAAPLLMAQGSGGQGGGGGWGGSGGRGGGGGGEVETLGNNLSVPVVFAEGYSLLGLPTTAVPGGNGLRPFVGQPGYPALEFWDNTTVVQKDGLFYYPQQSNSHWQADWLDGQAGGEQAIVDWGDNLTHQEWTARSVIRVENVLYTNSTLQNLVTYPMVYLFGEGTGEIQGTTGNASLGTYATFYSLNARLTIEKLLEPGGQIDTTVEPFSAAAYERFGYDGPGGYGAEVNVAGKVIYGYNWMLSQMDVPLAKKTGWWRLTFSLDPVASYTLTAEDGSSRSFTVNRNISLAGLDPADLLEEVLFKPTLPDEHTTVLEINVVEKRTGKKPDNPGRGGGSGK
jgi:hypothetical protein